MNLIDAIRKRMETRHTTATDAYWNELQRQAERGSKINEQALEAIESAAVAANKTTEDVSRDLALLDELRALGNLDAKAVQVEREAERLKAEAATLTNEAAVLREKAKTAEEQATRSRARMGSLRDAIGRAKGERARAVRELARRGFGPAQAEVDALQRAGSLREVQLALAEARKSLADVEAMAEGRTGDTGHLPLGRLRREVAELEAREAALQK